jgi:hypothetical protein
MTICLREASWRKRVGIEPTAPGVSPEPDGFEGRAGHQTRIASSAGPKHNTERAREQTSDADRTLGTLWRGFDELTVQWLVESAGW